MARPLIAVVDYGIGNLRSAEKALQRVGADARLTSDATLLGDAAGVVLPGVGHFGRCMAALREAGLEEPTVGAARSGRPFLGICVGMQMLHAASAEAPGVPGLGILPGDVGPLPGGVKHPQMQWNVVEVTRPGTILDVVDRRWVYFVHSYAVTDPVAAVAVCDYGGPVVAATARGPVVATQFHPEKSGRVGLELLGAFVDACREAT